MVERKTCSSTRTRRVIDVAGAAVAAILASTAVPAVLVLVVGDPLSGGLGHAWPSVPRDALCVLALAAWVAWAACCAQLARGVVARVRNGDVAVASGGSVVDRLAIRIAAGVLAFTGIGAPVVLPTSAGASPPTPSRPVAAAPAPPAPVPTADGGISAVRTATRFERADPEREPVSTASHVVQPGDSLWSVADQRLDDGAAWTELAVLNLGRVMDGHTRFVDPDHVEPGWRLRLPGGAPAHSGPSGAGDASGRAAEGGRLPELVALGLGSLTCAALARRAGRRRGADRFTGELDLEHTLSEQALDAATLVRRFDGVPALRAFESANCLLRSALQEEADPRGPTVRAICVSPEGVTFWLAEPSAAPPEGFAPRMDGAAWHVDHDRLGGHGSLEPYVPVALPVGTDEDGAWLACLGPGDVLPVLGEAAASLCRSLRAATTAWAWSDSILATDDPGDARLRAELAADPALARHLVFFGDPGALPPDAADRTAVVTTAAVAATDLSILVDRHGATLHPMGRVVRPHLLSEGTARGLEELTAWGGGASAHGPQATQVRTAPPPNRTAVFSNELRHARARATPRPDADEADAWVPGDVEVRLLTMTPRLEGLREELPPNRARRAVELVAYLALHPSDVVTSDRLRTRVLGSSDADAASKTLFNTAYAARRAMGVDDDGDPLFPAGTRNGHYQLSPRVTVDVRRAISLAAAGRDQDDPTAAIALYRAALDLVEGEPLANALAGYSWWEAEGHGGRIAAVLVDAACSMAVLAAEAGHVELAQWGLERARLVEPYSEALSRAAMRLAAAEGDADRLRLEWRECQRRVDALDPGSAPSSRTESLYGELSRLIAAGTRTGAPGRAAYAPAAGARAPAGS